MWHVVERCVNAAMILDSDHEPVRVKMVIKKMTPVAKTMRKNRTGKDMSGTYGPEAETSKMEAAVGAILQTYEGSLDQGGKASVSTKHTCLMAAVCSSIEKLDSESTVGVTPTTGSSPLPFRRGTVLHAGARRPKALKMRSGSKRRARG